MIPVIALVCLLTLLCSLYYLLKDFIKFIFQTSFKPNQSPGFIDLGEYGITWFSILIISFSSFVFYKFGIIACAYLVSEDLISFFMISRGVFTFNNALQHPFVWQNFVSGALVVPAFQFLACFGIFRGTKLFMSFLNQKYGHVIYDEKDLLYNGFIASMLLIAFEILFYSQDISLISGVAHLTYLIVSKLAIICSYLTICHLYLLRNGDYKSSLPSYVTFNKQEAAVIYTPWKVIMITYALSVILQLPFVSGTQFIGNNIAILFIYCTVCTFFYIILKYFLSNVYNSIGTIMLIESSLLTDSNSTPTSRKINRLLVVMFCVVMVVFLILTPKIFLSLFILSFTIVFILIVGHFFIYSALFGSSILQAKFKSVQIPVIHKQSVINYLRNTLTAIAISVAPMAGSVFCIITLLSALPKKYEPVNQDFINSVFDENGMPLFVENYSGNGSIPIPYEKLPTFLLKCLYLQEDRNFEKQNSWLPKWSNWHGISPATFYRIFGGAGGSNLNMQLIKNLAFPKNPPRDFQRKFIESIAAFQLSLQYTPEEIVTQYLNIVGLNGAVKHRGLMAASLYTFGRPVSQLNSLEMMYLVATLKRGQDFKINDGYVKYNKTANNANAVKEQLVSQAILWKQQNLLTTKELRVIKRQELRFVNHAYSANQSGSSNDFFKNQIKNSSLVGNTFQSSILLANQQAMHTAIQQFKLQFREYLNKDEYQLQFAALAIDVKSGRVLAHYGGENAVELTQFNNGSPVASLIKPFILIELLEAGFPATTTLYDGPVQGRTTPKNSSRVYSLGYLGFREILGRSLNAPMVNIREITAPIPLFNRTENTFSRMGIPKDPSLALDDKSRKIEHELNYPLGSRRMTVFNIGQIYQTLFNGGVFEKLTCLNSVYDPMQNRIITNPGESKRIYDQVNADLIKSALNRTLQTNGTGARLNLLVHSKRKLFAKTGTSDQAKQGYTVLSDGETLVVTFVAYGVEQNGRLDLNTQAKIPNGSGVGSAGVLAALIYNNLHLNYYSIFNTSASLAHMHGLNQFNP